MHTVFVRNYPAVPADRKEILRYAGAGDDVSGIAELLERCLAEASGREAGRVCWCEFPIREIGEKLSLGFAETDSAALRKNLRGCGSIIVFAATVGMAFDRLIARYAAISPAKALLFQAIGAERIESLCDAFCRDIAAEKAAEGRTLRPRFSPGYGDLPLQMQRDIFAVLDCPRKIGLSLNGSLLMSPSKSVTAIIGIAGDTPAEE
ncbi:MAG: Vitamin B12 dependent methionine synthase activation subunit [Ruminococcaceae bacterium]|nr:Vitamin B12 dependent methionine synthase activation subunit [Oscillospiraceae bacterium]